MAAVSRAVLLLGLLGLAGHLNAGEPLDSEVERLVDAAKAVAEGGNLADRRRAVDLYRRALTALGDRDPGRAAAIRHELAYELLELGEHDGALAELATARADARRAADGRVEADVLDRIAFVHFRLDHEQEALAALEARLAVARRLGDLALESDALANLATVHKAFGDYQEALEGYRRALALDRRLGDRTSEANTLNSLGGLYGILGVSDLALDTLRRSLALYRQAGAREQESMVLANIGHRLLELDRPEEALRNFEDALELERRLQGQPYILANFLSNLGRAQLALGRVEPAIASFREALAVALERRDPLQEAGVLHDLGEAYLAKGDVRRARAELERALELAPPHGNPRHRAALLAAVAQARRDDGDLPAARTAIEQYLDLIEVLRRDVLSGDLRSAYMAKVRSRFELYLDVLVRLHDAEPKAGHDRAAWRASETARARTLVELLAARAPHETASRLIELQSRAARVAARLSDVQRRLRLARENADPSAVIALEERVRELEIQRSLVEEQRWRVLRGSALANFEPVASEALGRRLGPLTAVVEYFIGEESSFVFALVGDRMEVRRLPPEAEIRRHLETAASWIRSPAALNRAAGEAALARLYQQLVAPIADRLAEVHELVIIPDGALHYLPFEVLITEGARGAEAARYLLQRWSVRYAPSATVLAEVEREHPRRADSASVVAFVDPTYSSRPEGDASGPLEAPDLVRSTLPDSRWPPPRLPHTAREGAALAALFPDSARLYSGREANETRFKTGADVAAARYLHVAAHGIVSEDFPHLSGLILALTPDSDDDGLLQAHEIARLDLDADLAVLSACRTGLGREVRGEGLVGFGQAFFTAGVRGLVVSLWDVTDRSTARLMEVFYRRLRDGEPPAQALRGAKLELQDAGWVHPYYWAPFVSMGKG